MSRPDDGLIHAWLDGELDAVEAARVAKLVETDAEWGAAAAEARGLIAASSRIVKSLDVVPAGVIPSGSKAGGAPPRRVAVRPWLRIAATVALVAGVGYVANESRSPTEVAGDATSVSPVADSAESDRTAIVQTTAPAGSPAVAPAVARDERAGGVGAGGGWRGAPASERRELAKTSATSADSIAAATAASRARRAEASEEQAREAPLTLRTGRRGTINGARSLGGHGGRAAGRVTRDHAASRGHADCRECR